MAVNRTIVHLWAWVQSGSWRRAYNRTLVFFSSQWWNGGLQETQQKKKIVSKFRRRRWKLTMIFVSFGSKLWRLSVLFSGGWVKLSVMDHTSRFFVRLQVNRSFSIAVLKVQSNSHLQTFEWVTDVKLFSLSCIFSSVILLLTLWMFGCCFFHISPNLPDCCTVSVADWMLTGSAPYRHFFLGWLPDLPLIGWAVECPVFFNVC